MLHGFSIIGGTPTTPAGRTFTAVNPATGDVLAPTYHEASVDDIHRAGELAAAAFRVYGRSSGAQRAMLLRTIATEIEALGDTLLDRYVAESGLPRGRAETERRRTCDQLRLFATVAEDDRWVEARIDTADPSRTPVPKPDTRFMLRPIGPVAVFGPANFPLAFTVAGGDTAAALAAGCPVIVKAHPSHPGTSELVASAIVRAVQACELPTGVFAMIHGGVEQGTALVQLSAIRAVGFTGSRGAGEALLRLCQQRPTPIPFFGELSGINPLCILPNAMATNAEALARGLHASVTLGCGQFCTKPGLVLYVDGAPGAATFRNTLVELMRGTASMPMLNAPMRAHYGAAADRLAATPAVTTLVRVSDDVGRGRASANAGLFACHAETVRSVAVVREEIFGPACVLVACRDIGDMIATIESLDGQLTATLHASDDDLVDADALLWALEQCAGRLVFNGYPTGVEVCDSMMHGGPWPATTDSRFTSVGTASILRFARPVCYQNAPARVLPTALTGAAS